MSIKSDGKPNVLDLVAQIRREGRVDEAETRIGPVEGKGTKGPHILMVDDKQGVVSAFLKREAEYANSDPELPCRLTVFRICGEEGGRADDLLDWLQNQPRFDAIYLDGNLGDQGNGMELAKRIRVLPGMKYQPIALITAVPSFLTKHGAKREHEGLRIIGKFDAQDAPIQQLVIELYDVLAQTRARFWADVKSELAQKLEDGETPEKAAEVLGEYLKDHYGAKAWYFRELRGDCLVSLAMEDGFDAPKKLSLKDTPKFLKEFVGAGRAEPWMKIDALSEEQAQPRQDMIGHRVIAAVVGSQVAGDLAAVLTVYRHAEKDAFSDGDMIQLHHVAVLLRLALAPIRSNERLKALSGALDGALQANSTSEIVGNICDFLQEQINEPLENRGIGTRTTARRFYRGGGELARWREAGRDKRGSLEEDNEEIISITEDCVYTRVIEFGETRWSGMKEEQGQVFLPDAGNADIHSYITVPLIHDGAVIGAINLKTEEKDAYSERDVSLAQAVARVAGAAVFEHRDQRFMAQLAGLTAAAINPADGKLNEPEGLLDEGAEILYRLTGYSEMLVFEGGDDPTSPWQFRRGWTGNGARSRLLTQDILEKVTKNTGDSWQETFLRNCLKKDDAPLNVYRGSGREGVSDVGVNNFREDGETRQHTVILLGAKGNHDRAIVLLFEHPRPMPNRYDDMLSYFARFLDSIYGATFSDFHDFYGIQRARALEARAARVYSQARHAVISHLASMASTIKAGRRRKRGPQEILDAVLEELAETEREFDASRVSFRDPVPELTTWRALWDDLLQNLKERIESAGVELDDPKAAADGDQIVTDPEIAKTVLHHLLDNALDHGTANGATTIAIRAKGKECTVCDNGKELDPEVAEAFFELGNTRKSLGGGHGLYLARLYAQDLGGTLVFERSGGRNCFKLTLGEVNDGQ